jgi:hypothetical protein
MGLGLAFKLFFKAFNRDFATRVQPLLEGKEIAVPSPIVPAAPPRPVTIAPMRSEALTLLAALQREARFVDFIKEPIAGYEDAQIGAAVRDIHRDCGAVLERLFALRPLVDATEGSPTEIPIGFDPNSFRLTGNVAGKAPYHGKIRHQGWTATQVQLPEWSGTVASANVVAPVEVEL